MRLALMLCSILIITVTNQGCCPECPTVPQKCIVPHTDEPSIDYSLCDDNNFSCIGSKALVNYESMKAYANKLKSNSEVCK